MIDNPDKTLQNECKISKWYECTELSQLVAIAAPGDILEFNNENDSHWAVYEGLKKKEPKSEDGEDEACVVHLENPQRTNGIFEKTKAEIVSQPLELVADKGQVRINNSLDKRTYLITVADKISLVNERIEKFKESKKIHRYASDQFANYCRYGAKISNRSRIIWFIVSILCVDALAGASAPIDVPVNRLAFLSVIGLGALIWLTLVVSKNTVVSLPRELQALYILVLTVASHFIGKLVWSTSLDLGSLVSLKGVATGVCVSAGHYLILSYFKGPDNVLPGKVLYFLGLSSLAYAFNWKLVVAMVNIVYIYETLRLSYVGSTDLMTYLTFTVAVSHLTHTFGTSFPIYLVVAIIIDDVIRLKFPAYKKRVLAIVLRLVFRQTGIEVSP